MIAIFIVLLTCIGSVQLYGYYNTPIKEDWRAASAFIKNTASPGDIIIVMPDYNNIPFNFYYNNSTWGTIQIDTSSKDELEKISSQRCNRKVAAYILVTGDLRSVDLTGEATSWIGSSRITEISNYNGVRVLGMTSGC